MRRAKREREREGGRDKKRIFLFLLAGFRPTLDHDRVSRALSPLLGRLPTRDDRLRYVKGRPLVPCSRKVRSMILQRNVFRGPLQGRCSTRMNEAGAVIRGNTRGRGPGWGFELANTHGRVKAPAQFEFVDLDGTDRSHTHAFLSSSTSRPKVIYFYRATFDASPSNLLVLKLGFERREKGGEICGYTVCIHDRDKPVFPVRSQVQENGDLYFDIIRFALRERDKLLNKRVQRNNRAGCASDQGRTGATVFVFLTR